MNVSVFLLQILTKYLRLMWNGKLSQFTCLAQALNTFSREFKIKLRYCISCVGMIIDLTGCIVRPKLSITSTVSRIFSLQSL